MRISLCFFINKDYLLLIGFLLVFYERSQNRLIICLFIIKVLFFLCPYIFRDIDIYSFINSLNILCLISRLDQIHSLLAIRSSFLLFTVNNEVRFSSSFSNLQAKKIATIVHIHALHFFFNQQILQFYN